MTQNSVVTHGDVGDVVNNSIAREYGSSIVVVCYEAGQDCFFAYGSIQSTLTVLQISNTYHIKDMMVDDDSLFFCGVTSRGEGFVGFYDINDFFSGSHNYYVNNAAMLSPQGNVKSLEKLITYVDNTTVRRIVSVGVTDVGTSCMVDVSKQMPGNSATYQTGELHASYSEKFRELYRFHL